MRCTISPENATLRIVAILCAIVPLSGCLATQALSERIRPHRRGELVQAKEQGGDYGPISVAGGPAREVVEVDDTLLSSPNGGLRNMRILLNRHQSGAPVLVFTPLGEMDSFLYGDGRRKDAARCIERFGGGDVPALQGALDRGLYAYVVFGTSDAGVKAMAAERINPKRTYGEEVVTRNKPLCVGLVVDPKGRVEQAMFGPWTIEPGRADGAPGACQWSPVVPAVDCLAETSIPRELLMKAGYVVTVPVDLVTAPLQMILGLVVMIVRGGD